MTSQPTRSLATNTTCHALPSQIRRAETILGLCACPTGHPGLYERLVDACRLFNGWDLLPILAEANGLGPLVYTHLKAAGIVPPLACQRELKGLYVRHRHANAVREQALREILTAYVSAGIETLVLKGAALAYLVYSQPGLRPMRDTDLLVAESDAKTAQHILADLGYDTSPDPGNPLSHQHHHLDIARRYDQGMRVSIEIHFRLFPRTIYYPSISFEDLIDEAVSFQMGGMTAYTLGYEVMLWHVYRHACGPPLLQTPLRFIHLSDIVGLIEKFHNRMDWQRVRRRYAQVIHILPLLNCLTPWEPELSKRFHLNAVPCPEGIGRDYQGWPRRRLPPDGNRWRLFKETLFPGEWWVRLFYGVNGRVSWVLHRWVRHPLHLLEWLAHDMIKDRILHSKKKEAQADGTYSTIRCGRHRD
jgi:hypothetical protein